MKQFTLTTLFIVMALLGFSQTQSTLPSGSTAYSTSLYKSPEGFIWTGKPGNYTNLGNKSYIDGLITFTPTDVSHWNIAYSWGNHSGLYKLVTWLPDWSEITNKPLNITADSYKLNTLNEAPESASAPGVLGEIRVTDTYIYICKAPNTWVRVELLTW